MCYRVLFFVAAAIGRKSLIHFINFVVEMMSPWPQTFAREEHLIHNAFIETKLFNLVLQGKNFSIYCFYLP
jgi:hypothetical protein